MPYNMKQRSTSLIIGCVALLLAAQLAFTGAAPAKPTVCPPRDGYRVLTDIDHKGDDISNFGKDPVRKCDADISCVGFTGTGIGKRALTPTYTSKGKCLYAKIPTVCPPASPEFNVTADVDCVGEILESFNGTGLGDVANACLRNGNCTAFTIAGVTKKCTGPLFASRGNCLYSYITTPCPEFLGFKVTPDADHKGDDIAEYGALAASNCLDNPDCRGFTSYGTGKATVVPSTLDRLNNVCLYQKLAKIDCTSISGYTAIANVDRYGDDIDRVNPSVALSRCDNDINCKGFNNNGWLKRSIYPLNASYAYCFYIKVATVCPYYPGYTAIPDVDRLNDTMETLDPSTPMVDVAGICESAGACQAFNTKRELKGSTGPLAASRGNCFYTKTPAACPPIFGYTAIPDTVVIAERIGSFGTAAVAQCNADPNCKAFDSFGSLTATVAPLGYARGNCVYVKS